MFSERTNWRLTQNRYTQAVEEVRARGVRVLDLTASNPTRVGLEYDSRAILEGLRSERSLDYDPQSKGLLSAREAVARYYTERRSRGERDVASNVSTNRVGGPAGQFTVDPERIVLTTSTSEGYSYVFRLLCNAGDELLVPKPSYPLFEFLADLQDVKLVPYPLIYDHGWQMDFHSMEKAVTARTPASATCALSVRSRGRPRTVAVSTAGNPALRGACVYHATYRVQRHRSVSGQGSQHRVRTASGMRRYRKSVYDRH